MASEQNAGLVDALKTCEYALVDFISDGAETSLIGLLHRGDLKEALSQLHRKCGLDDLGNLCPRSHDNCEELVQGSELQKKAEDLTKVAAAFLGLSSVFATKNFEALSKTSVEEVKKALDVPAEERTEAQVLIHDMYSETSKALREAFHKAKTELAMGDALSDEDWEDNPYWVGPLFHDHKITAARSLPMWLLRDVYYKSPVVKGESKNPYMLELDAAVEALLEAAEETIPHYIQTPILTIGVSLADCVDGECSKSLQQVPHTRGILQPWWVQ